MSVAHCSPIQSKLLAMMAWLHEFCTENQIRYYAIGGTLLGAMRHQGFIPWDDDIDVGMPRRDYERFQELTRSLTGRYVVETPQSPATDYRYPATKLYDATTTLIEDMHPRCKRGVYIDVFPLDGLGDYSLSQRVHFVRIRFLSLLLATRLSKVRPARTWYKNAAIRLSSLVPEALLDTKELSRHIDRLSARYDFSNSRIVGNLLGNYGVRELVPLEWFGSPISYNFENIEILGPSMGAKYLAHIYGDWEQLPPENKRGVQHDFIEVDLGKPYAHVS